MNQKTGTSLKDKAARAGAPQTRAEVTHMVDRAMPSPIIKLAQRWLEVEQEVEQTLHQADHFQHELEDRVLGSLLRSRADDMIFNLARHAGELVHMRATQPEDIGVKVYVLTQLVAQGDKGDLVSSLCASIRGDVDRLGIDIERLGRDKS